MKITRMVILFLALVVATLGTNSTAAACSCGPKPPPCEEYGHASAVFIGFVNSSKTIDTYCGRTQTIENAEEDLTFLRAERLKLSARISLNLILDAQSYYSLPKEKRDLPIGGVRATIEGPLVSFRGKMEAQGKPLDFVSDENGFIEASNLIPGFYTVGITPPEGTRIIPGNRQLFPNNRQPLHTNGRGCSKVSFVIGFTNQK